MKRFLTAVTLAVTTAFTVPAAPAAAGGTITWGYTAKNESEARRMRAGLAIYSLFNDVRSNGHITQNGVNNAAGIAQGGRNNRAIIHQEGRDHSGSIAQRGDNNACGLFQYGRGATGHVRQSGGQTCIVIQRGF
jgi:minor curlin subunit